MGLASAALGLGFHAIFQTFEPKLLATSVATAFAIMALIIIAISFRKANRVAKRMSAHSVEPVKETSLRIVVIAAGLCIVALIVVLWAL